MKRRQLIGWSALVLVPGCTQQRAGEAPETLSPSVAGSGTSTTSSEPEIGLLVTNKKNQEVAVSVSVTEMKTDEVLLSAEITLGTDEETLSWYAPDAFRPETRHRLIVDVEGGETRRTEVETSSEGGLHFIADITRDGVRFGPSQS